MYDSPRLVSDWSSSCGAPPAAATFISALSSRNTMVSVVPHVAPNATPGTSATTAAGPPPSGSLYSLLPEKYATHRPSGEKKGFRAFCVPARGTGASRSRQGVDELRRRLKPVRRHLGQRLQDRGLDVRGHGLPQLSQRSRSVREDLGDHGLHRRSGVRRLAGEQLIQNRGEGIDVAPRVDEAVARRLLRAHVLRGAEGQPPFPKARARGGGEGGRDARDRPHRPGVPGQGGLPAE